MPPIDPVLWPRVTEAFSRAAELDAADLEGFLAALAAQEPDVHREVLGLLEGDRAAGDRVTAGAMPLPTQEEEGVPDPVAEGFVGTRVGPYEIDGFLARGGMGMVFSAHRATGDFRQEVAIKLLRHGTGGSDLLRRFQAERAILAGLDHPNIARLLDGGVTDDGRPWFAMERVDGVPITDYVQRAGLPLDARLRLLVELCEAVDFAHRNLIVHRDLKPSNILVTEDGVPKLLDFGIAKLLGDDEGEDTALTRAGMQVLTPAYAAPEQIEGGSVTTATDSYALGLLLYELLTGRRAHPEGENEQVLREAIRTTIPIAPSRAVSQAASTPARNDDRRDEAEAPPSTWARRLRGDLDLICLKALRKEPERRYPSAAALRDDLRRYLDGRTVGARPDTWSYRTGKFVRRNRGVVSSTVLTLVSLVAFAIVSAVQARQLERQRDAIALERDKAQAVTDFLIDVFDSADPDESPGLDLTAREILGAGGARVRTELADQPEVQGSVMAAIGEAYRKLAAYDSAAVLLQGAVDRANEAYGTQSEEHAYALARLAVLRRTQRQLDDAEARARESLAIRIEVHGEEGLKTADAHNQLGLILHQQGDTEGAEAALLRAQEIRGEQLDPVSEPVLATLGNLASLYTDIARHDEAIPLMRQVVAGNRELYGEGPNSDVSISLNNLGSALQYGGYPDEALPVYLEALEMRRQLFEPDHPSILTVLNNLGSLYLDQDKVDEALGLFRDIADAHARRGDDIARSLVLNNMAVALFRVGRYEEVLTVTTETVEAMRDGFGADHPNVAYPLQTMGDALEEVGDTATAALRFLEAIQLRRDAYGDNDPNVAFTAMKLGDLYLDQGRFADAEPYFAEAMEIRKSVYDAGDLNRIRAITRMGRIREGQRRFDEARAFYVEALSEAREHRPDDPTTRDQLAQILEELDGREAEAGAGGS